MTEETVSDLEKISAPYGREITLQNVEHESGMRLIRMRIREGHRFTIMDLTSEVAGQLGASLTRWANTEDTT